MKRLLWILVLAFPGAAMSQAPAFDAAATKANLKKHISTLASDKFEGRETGTPGEKLAYEYLSAAFRDAGLAPRGTEGYLQPFSFTDETVMGRGCMLTVNGTELEPRTDFFPLAYSANGTVSGRVVRAGYGIVAPTLGYDDYEGLDVKGAIVLLELNAPGGNDPHGKWGEFAEVRYKIDKAKEHGAVAILFVNDSTDADDPEPVYKHKITPSDLPVVFLTGHGASSFRKEAGNLVVLGTELKKITGTGHNVVGYLDNHAPTTVVIGAHYDHLGYGGDGSLYRGEPAIHNGADDNASGTAALVELARILKNSNEKNNNYEFIAFSGEEKGLLGSNYYVKHPTLALDSVNYMINMDMVGRLKPEERTLQVLGVGTSPAWKDIVDGIAIDSVKLKESDSGVGPSDHTSFYLKDIPVLHFFTGSHSDYHKPTDDEDKINYDGEASVMKVILAIIDGADGMGKLAFSKTKDSENQEVPRFKVTLGVVPDYAFEGEGMRIDGVSDGRPASKAGLLSGDVVVQMGEHKVVDMMSYMKALSKFAKGDTTTVTVQRDGKAIQKPVTF